MSLFLHIAWREFRAIATSYPVLLVLMGGVFAYGLLYNYMYAPNVEREVRRFSRGDEEFVDATQNLLLVNAFRWVVSQDKAGNPFLKYQDKIL